MQSREEINSSYLNEINRRIDELEEYEEYINSKLKRLDPDDSDICCGNNGIEVIHEKIREVK